MKQRFSTKKENFIPRNLLLSLLLFGLLFAGSYLAVTSFSQETQDQAAKTLEAALQRDIAHCYAAEGAYPESLAYLVEHYGLTYDQDRFFVDYTILGSNMYPDVTIIDKEAEAK